MSSVPFRLESRVDRRRRLTGQLSREKWNRCPCLSHYFHSLGTIAPWRTSLVGIESDGPALRQLRTLFDEGTLAAVTDGQLLERFVTRSSEAAEAAFEALVERHGPMILRVCREVL